MRFFTPNSSQLKVLSALLTNIAAGLFLALFAINNFWVLFQDFIFAIICVVTAIKIEEFLKEYD